MIPAPDGKSTKKVKSEFMCYVEYKTALPAPPFEPKLLRMSLPDDRLFRFAGGSLAVEVKRPVLAEKLLGIPIDIIDTSKYRCPPGRSGKLDPADMALFPDSTVGDQDKPQRGRRHLLKDAVYTWMEKGRLLQNNQYDSSQRKMISMVAGQQETARQVEESKVIVTREEQLAKINATFDACSVTPQHPDPNLAHMEPLEIIDVLPHDATEVHYTYVLYDRPPVYEVQASKEYFSDKKVAQHVTDNSVLRSFNDYAHSMYVNVPASQDENCEKVQWVREFYKSVTPVVQQDNNYFFILSEDGMRYASYDSRLNLTKRARATPQDVNALVDIATRPTEITLNFGQPEGMTEKDLFGDESDDGEQSGGGAEADGKTIEDEKENGGDDDNDLDDGEDNDLDNQ